MPSCKNKHATLHVNRRSHKQTDARTQFDYNDNYYDYYKNNYYDYYNNNNYDYYKNNYYDYYNNNYYEYYNNNYFDYYNNNYYDYYNNNYYDYYNNNHTSCKPNASYTRVNLIHLNFLFVGHQYLFVCDIC